MIDIIELVEQVVNLYKESHLRIVTAESCTGGMLSKLLTDLPGSSKIFDRGFITYSNESKVEMLGIAPSDIEVYGPVSAEIAKGMALGALKKSRANIAVSITGIAGPGDDTFFSTPAGTVYIAICSDDDQMLCLPHFFTGSRQEIREMAAKKALDLLLRLHPLYNASAAE